MEIKINLQKNFKWKFELGFFISMNSRTSEEFPEEASREILSGTQKKNRKI